jgi:hypothetical protein
VNGTAGKSQGVVGIMIVNFSHDFWSLFAEVKVRLCVEVVRGSDVPEEAG